MPEHQQTQKSTESKSSIQKQATPVIQAPVSNPMAIIQRARINPKSLTHADVMQLQRTIGNRAVGRLLSEIGLIPSVAKPVQRQEIPEEEEPLQGKIIQPLQRQEIPEEEEPLQGKMIGTIQRQEPEEGEKLQMKPIVQRQEIPEEEEPLQGKMTETIQRQEMQEEEEILQGKFENKPHQETCLSCSTPPIQREEKNLTGIPDNLKAGVENLSGIDMSDVRVHYSSSKPAEVGALAYTQGTDIHVAPGQERHLPHEAWHVVQQAQGRVRPTMQLKDIAVNDDEGLEREADIMGIKALKKQSSPDAKVKIIQKLTDVTFIQLKVPGFEQYLSGEIEIPDGWVDAYLEDISDPLSRAHLFDTDIYAVVDHPDGVELIGEKNHFDVKIIRGKTVITIKAVGDGNCAVHAAHAILNRDTFHDDVDRYQAPHEYIAEFRSRVRDIWNGKREQIKYIIVGALSKSSNVEETGFGSHLLGFLRPIAEAAFREHEQDAATTPFLESQDTELDQQGLTAQSSPLLSEGDSDEYEGATSDTDEARAEELAKYRGQATAPPHLHAALKRKYHSPTAEKSGRTMPSRVNGNHVVDAFLSKIIPSEMVRVLLEDKTLEEYTLKGSQQAETVSTFGSGKTKRVYSAKTRDCMHSEMGDLNLLIENGEVVIVNGVARSAKGKKRKLTKKEYSTKLPHCGHCTCILTALDLPLTHPSAGVHQYGSHGKYPLPTAVRESREFWVNLTNKEAELDEMLSSLEMKWEEFIQQRELFNHFMEVIMKKIDAGLKNPTKPAAKRKRK